MPETAYITYRVNPYPNEYASSPTCCICINTVGHYIFYYDRGERHYTCVCHDCIAKLRESAKKEYIVKETYSKYDPNQNSGHITVTRMKNNGKSQPCNRCERSMENYIYSCDTLSGHHKDICAYCTEQFKYKARSKGYMIYTKVANRKSQNVSDTPTTKPYPQEHSTSFLVICSKCFKHTFEYKSWSYGNLTGLCSSCAHNM